MLAIVNKMISNQIRFVCIIREFLISRLLVYYWSAGLPVPAGIPVPDPYPRVGWGMGQLLTGRVGYGWEVHGYRYTVLPVRKMSFYDSVTRKQFFSACSLTHLLCTTARSVLAENKNKKLITHQ